MHGVINLNKPKGITSQDAVTMVKRLLKAKKAGHAGTLDPIATGVLLVCVNEATKAARFLQNLDKEYIAELKLGERTDTLDADGRVIEKKEGFSVTEDDIRGVLEAFRGEIRQVPPMYSALKRHGRRLYELAREGIEVERQERVVNILRLDVVRFEPPYLEILVACSKGTYIRTLADDIGRELGTGAHVTKLMRTKIGGFKVEDSCTHRDEALRDKVIPLDNALSHLRELNVNEADFPLLSKGTQITLNDTALAGLLTPNEHLRLKSPDGKLFALGTASFKPGIPLPRINIERLLHI
ncbi:MAG: tRNA pseudouridine(55) synthase TruB [Thermodesulfovibrionales bacterium]|nr:tRNA pseudouridine(55) synthase TruB [Thermodesulfovibrionales bacterium]